MADLLRWTDRYGQVWECDAYDHGPFCRLCRHAGSVLDEFTLWLRHGIDHGWVTDVVCETHHGVETTEAEMAEIDEGSDPCIPVMRVWADNIA